MPKTKLQTLLEAEGYSSLDEVPASVILDSIVPAICCAKGCDATTEMEPDQDKGYCEECGKNSVKSICVLAGII